MKSALTVKQFRSFSIQEYLYLNISLPQLMFSVGGDKEDIKSAKIPLTRKDLASKLNTLRERFPRSDQRKLQQQSKRSTLLLIQPALTPYQR